MATLPIPVRSVSSMIWNRVISSTVCAIPVPFGRRPALSESLARDQSQPTGKFLQSLRGDRPDDPDEGTVRRRDADLVHACVEYEFRVLEPLDLHLERGAVLSRAGCG